MTPAWSDGYFAGVVNDRENPHSIFSLAFVAWAMGNAVGVEVHLATVEAVYLHSIEAEQ